MITQALWLLLSTLSLSAPQDPKDDVTYSIDIEQGWLMRVDAEGDVLPHEEFELAGDMKPTLLPRNARVSYPRPDSSYRLPDTSGPSRPPRGRGPRHTRGDPLKLVGTLTLKADGPPLLDLKRIEYWDATQRYWIEIGATKIKTFNLGANGRWTGTPEEWSERLGRLEAGFIQHYLTVAMGSGKARNAQSRIGFGGQLKDEAGRHLFVASCVEEQLVALLLARLSGLALTDAEWAKKSQAYPKRVPLLARALVGRILSQARGTLAPENIRDFRPLSVTSAPWLEGNTSVPSLHWDRGEDWYRVQREPLRQARGRLESLLSAPEHRIGISEILWRESVKKESKALVKAKRVPLPERPPELSDLMPPRMIVGGSRTYDYRESARRKDGMLDSSRAKVHGRSANMAVAYFHPLRRAWRVCTVTLETWYAGEVVRQKGK